MLVSEFLEIANGLDNLGVFDVCKAWRSTLEKRDAGEIDSDEYELWKGSFSG